MNSLIIYHADCLDGYTAAWLIEKGIKGQMGGSFLSPFADDYLYLPIVIESYAARYNEPPPDVRRKDVWVVDFSYPRETLLRMKDEANSFRLFDHHVTAKDELLGIPGCVFDENECGATLVAREYDCPRWSKFLRYIRDWDLWQFKLPNSRIYRAAMQSYAMTLKNWDYLAEALDRESPRRKLYHQGKGILAMQEKAIELAMRESEDGCHLLLGGYVFPCQNVTDVRIISEVGHRLCKPPSHASITWRQEGDKVTFSLRSDKNGPHVGELARKYGGGGHEHAAGFVLPLDAAFDLLMGD